jgi:mono/diheme cytochrome c family protein
MKRIIFIFSLIVGSTVSWADEPVDIYRSKCKGCHGEDGKAQTKIGRAEKIDDFTSPNWQSHHTDEQIRHTIENGSEDKPKMKPFKEKLSPDEISGLVNYIRGFKKK